MATSPSRSRTARQSRPDLAIFVPDGYGMTSSVDQWCPLANFFLTTASASDWAESNRVEGLAFRVATLAPLLIERWRIVLDYNGPE